MRRDFAPGENSLKILLWIAELLVYLRVYIVATRLLLFDNIEKARMCSLRVVAGAMLTQIFPQSTPAPHLILSVELNHECQLKCSRH